MVDLFKMQEFRDIFGADGVALVNNFRPLQALNKRSVQFTRGPPTTQMTTTPVTTTTTTMTTTPVKATTTTTTTSVTTTKETRSPSHATWSYSGPTGSYGFSIHFYYI